MREASRRERAGLSSMETLSRRVENYLRDTPLDQTEALADDWVQIVARLKHVLDKLDEVDGGEGRAHG